MNLNSAGDQMIMIIMNFQPRLLLAVVAGLGLLVAASACTPEQPASSEGKLTIVVGAYPFQYVTERVAGELAEVTNLLAPGADGHDLELSPQQVAMVGQADLVVYQADYQASFDSAVEQQSPKNVLDTGEFLALLDATGASHEHEDDGHDHAGYDPHVWLNPLNMMQIGEQTAKTLGELDPDNAEIYRANAEAMSGELNALDDQFATGLANCRTRTFVTNHAAFGYLADRYQLQMVGISGLSTEEEPSPARIAEVQQIARANELTTIFYEAAVSPKVAEVIADDLGLATDVLDPLETLSAESRGADYIEVMNSNLTALAKANGCQ